MRRNITILGDSRVFDTYYTNSRYAVRYGYNKTFPHVWRKAVLADPAAGYDVVHIPDHFRGGTIQNNIVRLALTDPAIVVILDGIWETLLNREHYNDYLKSRPSSDYASEAGEPAPDYSDQSLVELFKANALSLSPEAFAEQQRRLISYFRRRSRQVIWMALPVPPKRYIGSNYHAGDYTPIADWDECLTAVNEAVAPVVEGYGGVVLGLTELMEEIGGPEMALIDQWHFSEAFHACNAEELDALSRRLLLEVPRADHVSRDYMLGAPGGGALLDDVVLYEGDPENEIATLRSLSAEQILLYPSELGEINNPRGNDRAEFEKQADR